VPLLSLQEATMSFVKIHPQMFESSIMDAPAKYRLVWFYMLMACDRDGNVYGTTTALARKFNMPLEQVEEAIEFLKKPDPNSTSKEEGGRRVLQIDTNLYFVVNYLFYRGLKDPSEERRKVRERVRKHRAKKEECNAGNKNVTKSNDKAEAEAEEDTYSPPAEPMDDTFGPFWEIYPRKEAKKKAQAAWRNLTKKDQIAVMEDLPKYRDSVAGKEKQFILLPTSYLNGRRWEDQRDAKQQQYDSITRRAANLLGFSVEDVHRFYEKHGVTPTTKEEMETFMEVPF
jgi:hypothetical protein